MKVQEKDKRFYERMIPLAENEFLNYLDNEGFKQAETHRDYQEDRDKIIRS